MTERAAPDSCEPGVDQLSASLPADRVLSEAVLFLKGFADPTRLKILSLLRNGEVCVHQIVATLDMTQSAVSHQLRTLRSARLVAARKHGRHVHYRLADQHVHDMLSNILSHSEELF